MSVINKYKIEHKITTLAHCAVRQNTANRELFNIENVTFSPWGSDVFEDWIIDGWVSISIIQAENYLIAFHEFKKKMLKLIPRISLISQCYIEFLTEPYLIHREANDIAFFRYTKDISPVGLMFTEKEQKALNELMTNIEIPEAFYYYWNDAVNATGYSAKLLLMFSAIEALVKKNNGKKDWSLIKEVLGKELVEKLFGTRKNSHTGLRNRLVHGEYFNYNDQENYLENVHNKVIGYFNKKILSQNLISEDITDPQRHFFGNKVECRLFVKTKDNSNSFNLKEVWKDFSKDEFRTSIKYESVFNNNLINTY